MSHRYTSFGSYVKKTFGTLVQKVNIDAGFTCPNRDGTVGVGGCVFCNNESFKPGACRPALSVREQVRNGIAYLGKRYGAGKFLAYFQAYTNTYAPVDELERIYSEALEEPSVLGLAIGTRPDCVESEKLDMLQRLARTHFVLVEYGLQSPYERSLRYINRGHTYGTFLDALEAARRRGIHTGVHTIVGIPTESREETLRMATELSETGVEFMKIHQLQVIKDTPLARMYAEQAFPVFVYRASLARHRPAAPLRHGSRRDSHRSPVGSLAARNPPRHRQEIRGKRHPSGRSLPLPRENTCGEVAGA
jgi:radical SAM protein (TIGR01212 family)